MQYSSCHRRSVWFKIASRTPLLAGSISPSRDRELGVPAAAGECSRSKKEQHSRGSSRKGPGKALFSLVIKAGQSQMSCSIRNKQYCCSLSNFPAALLTVRLEIFYIFLLAQDQGHLNYISHGHANSCSTETT